jgi:hypothetical protein
MRARAKVRRKYVWASRFLRAEYAWYGEMRDQVSSGAGITDPAEQPIELSRIHLFRFDERGREISMVFQNDHTQRSRQARLNVLCKTKA